MPIDKKEQQLIDFERTTERHTEETARKLKQFPFGKEDPKWPAPPKPASDSGVKP